MIDKRPNTAQRSIFMPSMAEGLLVGRCAALSFIPRGTDSRDAALASRMTYGTVQNQLIDLSAASSAWLKRLTLRVSSVPAGWGRGIARS